MITNQTRSSHNPSRTSNNATTIYSGLIHRIHSAVEPLEGESISIGIVGCHSKAGVSTICANFASSCSFDIEQPVLVISTNPGDTQLDRMLYIKSSSGLNDLVQGTVAMAEVITPSPIVNLGLISSGLSARESLSPFLVSRFPSIIAEAKRNFRVVLVDLQPVSRSATTVALANQLDAVVLVVDSNRTTNELAQNAKQSLERSGARLVGSILNRHSK